MSELVEKVGRAIRSRAAFGSTEQSRAAIAAVLEHLADNVSDEMVSAYLQCKPTNPRNIHNAIRESISAALRAAAGGEK